MQKPDTDTIILICYQAFILNQRSIKQVNHEALKRGVKVTGATCHFVDAGTDTGPIILQKAVEIKQGDTPKELQLRVMEEAEWKIMPKAIDLIANGRVRVEDGRVIITE